MARSDAGFPQGLFAQVQATPGVRFAAPILQVPASVVGPAGRRSLMVYGSVPDLLRELNGSLVQGFNAAELAEEQVVAVTTAIADGLHLRTGDLARLQIAGRSRVVGVVVLGRRDIGGLADQSIALAPLAYLQQLGGLDQRLSRMLIEAEPGQVGAVQKRLGPLVGGGAAVRSAKYEPKLFDKTAQPTAAATLVSSTLSSLVGFLFAACAMLVTVTARRALAVDLRRSGYTDRQITGILLVDAIVLGVCAVVVGLVLGEALSRHGFSADVGFMEGAFPIGDERVVTWTSVAIAAAGGLVAAVAGALGPLVPVLGSRRRRPGGGAATGRGARYVRELVGLALLALVVVITAFAPRLVIVGVVALIAAVVLLLPVVLDLVVRGVGGIARRAPRTLMAVELALPQLTAPVWRVRSLAIATIGALAVFGAAAVQGSRANLQDGLDRAATVEYVHVADVWVAPYGAGRPVRGRVDPGRRRRRAAGHGAGDPRRAHLPRRVPGRRRQPRLGARARRRTRRGRSRSRRSSKGSAAQATARFREGGWVDAVAGDRRRAAPRRRRPLRAADALAAGVPRRGGHDEPRLAGRRGDPQQRRLRAGVGDRGGQRVPARARAGRDPGARRGGGAPGARAAVRRCAWRPPRSATRARWRPAAAAWRACRRSPR